MLLGPVCEMPQRRFWGVSGHPGAPGPGGQVLLRFSDLKTHRGESAKRGETRVNLRIHWRGCGVKKLLIGQAGTSYMWYCWRRNLLRETLLLLHWFQLHLGMLCTFMTNACLEVHRQSGKICLMKENRKAHFSFLKTSVWMDILIFPERNLWHLERTHDRHLWGETKENKMRWRIFVASARRQCWTRQQYNSQAGQQRWGLVERVFMCRYSVLQLAGLLHNPSGAFAVELCFMCCVQIPKPWSHVLSIIPWPELAAVKGFLCDGSAGLDSSCRSQGCPLPDLVDMFLFLHVESWSGEIWDPSHMTGTFGHQIISGWTKSRHLKACVYV